MQTSTKKNKGFTLLELIIAITILAALMAFSNQSIQNGMRAKAKIQDQNEDLSSVRDALRQIEKDVNLAMHYRDLELEMRQQVQKSGGGPQNPNPGGQTSGDATSRQQAQQAAQQAQQALTQWLAQDPKRVDPTTNFVGAADEMHFITMNAPRLSESIAQADFIKVGYYLSDCNKPGSTGHSSKCLLRSSDPLVEGDVTVNGPATVLLENVSEFKLRYINVNKQDWVNDWNSKTGDAGSKNYFPESVEISLKIQKGEGDKKKKVSMQIVAPIRFPNNPVAQNNNPAQPGSPGSPSGPPQPPPIPGGP